MFGTVARIKDPGGYGFIQTSDGESDTFFHCSVLDGLEFGPRLVERRVEFEVMQTERGRKAINVRPAH